MHNVNLFALDNQGNATEVLRVMDGTGPCLLKAMSVFINTDTLLRRHLEIGLPNLRAATEAAA